MEVGYHAICHFIKSAKHLYKDWVNATDACQEVYEYRIFITLGESLGCDPLFILISEEDPERVKQFFAEQRAQIKQVLQTRAKCMYGDPEKDPDYETYHAFFKTLKVYFNDEIWMVWCSNPKEKSRAEEKEERKARNAIKLKQISSVALLLIMILGGAMMLHAQYDKNRHFTANKQQILANATQVITEVDDAKVGALIQQIPFFIDEKNIRAMRMRLNSLNEIYQLRTSKSYLEGLHMVVSRRKADIEVLCKLARAYERLLVSLPDNKVLRQHFEDATGNCKVEPLRIMSHLGHTYESIADQLDGSLKKYYLSLAKINLNSYEQALTRKTEHQRTESLFSAWDGSARSVVNAVKNRMHNPDSFEHVSTNYIDYGDHVQVNMVYRGSNAFGGTVTESTTMSIDKNGNLVTGR